MNDILPEEILNDLRIHYFAGVMEAEIGYQFNNADEDSLTGALGQALLNLNHTVELSDGRIYILNMYHHKIRGRGYNAPEHRTGADGIFQIEVIDQIGQVIRRKGLLFQAKKKWTGTDSDLLNQAQSLGKNPHQAIVIDYSPRAYMAAPAEEVVVAEGNRRKMADGTIRRLGDILGNEFLYCRSGLINLYWDAETEILHDPYSQNYLSSNADSLSTIVRRLR